MQMVLKTTTTPVDGDATTTTETLNFTYDVSGTPMSVKYGNTTYYYVVNIQGDVVAILNTSGTAVVEYTYDAWGKLYSTIGTLADTLGEVNPLTYRGYVYDSDTELYYLQSRYYDPEVGRFINADGLVATGQGLLGNNMFAYCNVNPVNYSDHCGFASWGTNTVIIIDGWKRRNKKNSQAMELFWGGDSDAASQGLPEGSMAFVENIYVIPTLIPGVSYIWGKTIVMDDEKYCEYTFRGLATGVSTIPFDVAVTKGLVYGLESATDYCGTFWGYGANFMMAASGGAVASDTVYAEIISGMSYLSGSASFSLTYYSTTSSTWTYGAAPLTEWPNPYNYQSVNSQGHI